MALVHYFWQRFMDKKAKGSLAGAGEAEIRDVKPIEGGALFKTVYAILPLLPILLLIVVFFIGSFTDLNISISVEVATLFSFVVAIICQIIRRRKAKEALDGTEAFFKGMGGAMPIVALLVAASVFVTGLKAIGLIQASRTPWSVIRAAASASSCPDSAGPHRPDRPSQRQRYRPVLRYGPLMVPLAAAAGINVLAISIPMGLAGNLLRAVSPVSAVTMIVAGSVKRSPIEVVKRTSLPMIVGTVFMFILSMIVFLPMGA